MNNKNVTIWGPKRAPLLICYELSIVVLIDSIAILQTPVIFLIQIITNSMYLLHFCNKNIKNASSQKLGFQT